MQSNESQQEQVSSDTAVKSFNWKRTIIAIFITTIIAGTNGYLLGIRNSQSILPSKPLPSPRSPMITQILPTFIELSDPDQRVESHPTPTQFNPPASWQVYKSEFSGYQYSYPPTWNHYPEMNAPASGVIAPGVKYPDGYFTVERETGGADWCESRRKWLLESNPSMKQSEIMISRHSAFQIEGKNRLDDGYDYDRKVVLVARRDNCYSLRITSRDNPEQMVILNQILSTFAFTD